MTDTGFQPENTLAARLASVQAGTPLAQAMATRDAASANAEASYRVLFETVDTARLSTAERFSIALTTAEVHKDAVLVAHYRARVNEAGGVPHMDARQEAVQRHVRTLASTPLSLGATDLKLLEAAGWSADAILTISQIVAYVSFQSRYVIGLAMLAGSAAGAASGLASVPAGVWHTQPSTTSGKPAPVAFTRDELNWEPWIAPRDRATLSEVEAAQLEKAGHINSDYFLLLARDMPVLDHRTRTDKGIFFTHGGLPRAERELAAAVTSKVNGCIYCASVHARKAAQLSREVDAVDALLAVSPGFKFITL